MVETPAAASLRFLPSLVSLAALQDMLCARFCSSPLPLITSEAGVELRRAYPWPGERASCVLGVAKVA